MYTVTTYEYTKKLSAYRGTYNNDICAAWDEGTADTLEEARRIATYKWDHLTPRERMKRTIDIDGDVCETVFAGYREDDVYRF